MHKISKRKEAFKDRLLSFPGVVNFSDFSVITSHVQQSM